MCSDPHNRNKVNVVHKNTSPQHGALIERDHVHYNFVLGSLCNFKVVVAAATLISANLSDSLTL